MQIELVRMRSVFRPVNATFRPDPSAPMTFSTGTSTSSKNTWWLRSGWFITVRIGDHVKPAEAVSTMNTVNP